MIGFQQIEPGQFTQVFDLEGLAEGLTLVSLKDGFVGIGGIVCLYSPGSYVPVRSGTYFVDSIDPTDASFTVFRTFKPLIEGSVSIRTTVYNSTAGTDGHIRIDVDDVAIVERTHTSTGTQAWVDTLTLHRDSVVKYYSKRDGVPATCTVAVVGIGCAEEGVLNTTYFP